MSSKPSRKQLLEQSIAHAAYASKALLAAKRLKISSRSVERFPLDADEQLLVADLAGLSGRLRKKLITVGADVSIGDSANIVMAIAVSLPTCPPEQLRDLVFIAKKLTDRLEYSLVTPAEHGRKATDTLFQFKITLLGVDPPIWRRIQVSDGTLDRLHELIQTSMGWTNSHLHLFQIDKQLYGDPMLLKEMERAEDSTTTLLSDLLAAKRKRFRFQYDYDFGDGWEHGILFEGNPPPEAGRQYPLCLEGERACPPDDCGGIDGYAEFLEAIRDKTHEEHEEMLEWIGGWFDPEEFDPATATKSMKKGLPDWRATAGW